MLLSASDDVFQIQSLVWNSFRWSDTNSEPNYLLQNDFLLVHIQNQIDHDRSKKESAFLTIPVWDKHNLGYVPSVVADTDTSVTKPLNSGELGFVVGDRTVGRRQVAVEAGRMYHWNPVP
jgi:hypothetical protein